MPQTVLSVPTRGAGLYEFTKAAQDFVHDHAPDEGLLTVYVQHTSCSLTIQENADPDVQRDLNAFFRRLVPSSDDPSMHWITHVMEGPDDMPVHIKAALTLTSVSIPVSAGQLLLGTWQGLYLFEHRDRPHSRNVILHLSR
jgi:secondary thiamine-phosphate synthase enzyme